jgi:hypothetical protein
MATKTDFAFLAKLNQSVHFIDVKRWIESISIPHPRWRNWLARLTVNQEVDGSSPSRGVVFLHFLHPCYSRQVFFTYFVCMASFFALNSEIMELSRQGTW